MTVRKYSVNTAIIQCVKTTHKYSFWCTYLSASLFECCLAVCNFKWLPNLYLRVRVVTIFYSTQHVTLIWCSVFFIALFHFHTSRIRSILNNCKLCMPLTTIFRLKCFEDIFLFNAALIHYFPISSFLYRNRNTWIGLWEKDDFPLT